MLIMTSREDTGNYTFKDNFSYIAAFLSVLVGLAAFKDFAETNSARIIYWDFTFLVLTMPFIISMILATYVGALAMQSRNITFTLFPLTKILEWVANGFAVLGLLYPFVILVAYLFTIIATFVIPSIPFPTDPETISLILSGVASVIAVYTAARVSIDKVKNRYDNKSNDLLIEFSHKEKASHAASTMDILVQYNVLTNLAKWILRIRGYSISGDNLPFIGRKLFSLGVFDKTDLAKIEDIRVIRNNIAHGTELPNKRTIKETGKIIDELATKLKAELLKKSQSN